MLTLCPLCFQGCCSELEAIAAGGVTEASTVQEMEQQILKLIPKLQLKIGEMPVAFIKIMMMQRPAQVSCFTVTFSNKQSK